MFIDAELSALRILKTLQSAAVSSFVPELLLLEESESDSLDESEEDESSDELEDEDDEEESEDSTSWF